MKAWRSLGDIRVTAEDKSPRVRVFANATKRSRARNTTHAQCIFKEVVMGTLETLAVVAAVYCVVFVAHRASRAVAKSRD
jgi:hypothetical protein